MTVGSEETTILDRPISALFEGIVDARPYAVALETGETRVTYRELDAAANQVAQGLRAVGVGAEVPVGICLERSATWVVVALGVLKAGGVYVHLEPSYPATRVAWQAADANVRVVVSARQCAGALAGISAPVLWAEEAAWAEEPATRVASAAGPDHLACVIYTSGSTGKPKGVGVPHRGLARLVLDTDYVQLTPAEVLMQFAPLAFDASTFEVWGALLTGARLVIAPAGPVALRELGQVVQERGVTTLLLTTALFTQMVEHELASLGGVRQMVVGGEVMPVEAARRLLTAYPAMRVLNCYGPTENTTISYCHPVKKEDLSRPRVPIGQPIANSTGYVVTPSGELAPEGVTGELYVGGAGLARGYVGQGGLTAARFVPDAFSGTPGARLYRTGDRVRWLGGGVLDFLGRFDTQVKVRGFRVEPGEVEAALRQQGGVQEAAVVARERAGGGHELAAFLVAARPGGIQVGEVREALLRTLPEYMVPARIVMLDHLPLTPNGKIDRHALAASITIEHETPVDRPRSIEPTSTPIEELLGTIWAQVLNVDPVDRDEDFFYLGGDSLAAMAIVAHVRRLLHVDIPLRLLFQHPTIAALAREIEKRNGANAQRAAGSIPSIARIGALPLSLAQERVWLLHRLDPTGLAYTAQATLTFKGDLKPALLKKSLHTIVRRHEIYRTAFALRDGELSATLHRELKPFPFRIVDLESLPHNEREKRFEVLTQAEIRTPFELEHLPLVRWTLFRFDERHHLLLHTEHHIVHDGWSFSVLLSELLECYQAFTRGEPLVLEPVSVQCVDFAAWEKQQQSSEQTSDDIRYWARQLTGATSDLHLPYDRNRPSVFTFAGSGLRLSIPEHLYADVRTFARNEAVSQFAIFFAAFVALLRLYDNAEVCVGVGVANRRSRDVQRTLGMLINTIVLRIDAAPDPTLRELVHDCWSIALEGYARQSAPLNEVVRAVHPSRDPGQNPLFRVMFSAHDAPVENVDIPGLTIELREGLNNGSAKFDLNVIVVPPIKEGGSLAREGGAGAAVINWEYNTDVFDESTIRRLGAHYQAVLQQMTSAPERRVSELALMNDAERSRIIFGFNDTKIAYAQAKCLHELIEEQVDRTPEKEAVVFDGHRLTFAELNARANELAGELRDLGIGPDVPAGICMERSLEMVVAMVGILKAGGAYVPIDPDYPEDRVAFILKDTNAPVVLTQEHLVSRLPAHDGRTLLPSNVEELSARSHMNPGSRVTADNAAYVIYTSGSTGRPKGVVISHRGITNRLLWMQDQYQLTGTDRVLQKTPYSFDVSVWEFFWPLLTGATLVLALPERHKDGLYLIDLVKEEQITTIHFVPSMLRAVLEFDEFEKCTGLKQVFSSGEALGLDLQELFFSRAKATLHNLYGPTEASVDVTYWECDRRYDSGLVPIGRPIANTQIHVLDANQRAVPIGVAGELYIGGAGLARGYLNRPDLTADKFIPNPFSLSAGERLYRSGDLARYLADSNIEYLGRIDDQVKIRGHRIELGDIESTLALHPGLKDCAVIVAQEGTVSNISEGKRLVACVVAKAGVRASSAELRSYLARKLPEYMIPSTFIELDQLPVTANGKLDRKALASQAGRRRKDQVRPSAQASPMLPVTTQQIIVARTFQELLHVDSLSFTENLFDLGCDSLTMLKAQSKLIKSFPHLTLIDLFRHPTMASLAEHLTGAGSPPDKWARFKDRVTRHKETTTRRDVSDRPRRRP